LAGEQGNQTHFPQIDADRIVRFIEQPGRQVNVEVLRTLFFGFQWSVDVLRSSRSFCRGNFLVELYAIALKSRKQLVDFFVGVDSRRQDVIHLVEEEVAPLLT